MYLLHTYLQIWKIVCFYKKEMQVLELSGLVEKM